MKKLSILASTLLLLFACSTDNDYDLSSIDATIGVNMNDVDMPENSTSRITLSEIIDLGDSKTISFDKDNNYVFSQKGEDIEPIHPLVDIFTVSQRKSTGYDVGIEFYSGSASPKKKAPAPYVQGSGKLQLFDYEGEKPKGAENLEVLMGEAPIEFKLFFPKGLSKVVPSADRIDLFLPDFMTMEDIKTNANYEREGNNFHFTNVPTDKDLFISAKVTKIDFNKANSKYGSLTQTDKLVDLEGNLFVEFYDSDPILENLSQLESRLLRSEMSSGDFVITAATGKFSPDLNINSLGSVTLDNVPDFLTKEGVVIDLDNIKLFADIANDMHIGSFISGSLISVKGGKQLAKVDVPEFKVNADGYSHICICRKATDELRANYTCVEVPELSTLIETFPDKIDFDVTAHADNSVSATIELGKEYTIAPSYRVEADIAFGEKANIICEKTLDKWNKDLENIELSKDSKVTILANVNNTIPLNLLLKSVLIDKNGNEITDVNIDTKDVLVPASIDGKTPSKAEVKITILDGATNLMNRLDGLKFFISGAAKADGGNTATGVPLNADTQYIEFKNIRININGKLIFDAN